MNREIKFRAWDTSDKDKGSYMLGGYDIKDSIFNHKDVRSLELMQYTGLKDKNGVEIYEGDIVKVTDPYNNNESIDGAEVVFSNDYVGGWVISADGHNLNLGSREKYIRVIGNIYENPDLLK